MIEFENTVTIERPVEEVFAFVADFENVPRWNYFVRRVERQTEGALGEGTTFHQVRKTDEQTFQITEYAPNQRVVIETLPGSSPQFEMCFLFEADAGRTRVVDAWKLQLDVSPVLELLGRKKVKTAVAENLGKLKELLETGSTQLQDGRRSEVRRSA